MNAAAIISRRVAFVAVANRPDGVNGAARVRGIPSTAVPTAWPGHGTGRAMRSHRGVALGRPTRGARLAVITDPKDTANSFDEQLMGEDEVFLPAREEYHHESPVVDANDGSTAGSAAQRQQSRATAAPSARGFSTSATAEFPPPPTTIEYEDLGPNVELARVVRTDSADATRADTRDVDSRLSVTREALPVLVGWFGCKRSHLRKYAKMYADIGYDNVVCVIPPTASTLFPALGDAFAASALESVVKAKARIAELNDEDAADVDDDSNTDDVSTSGVVLHIFSNGGYLFAGNIAHAQTGFVADTEMPLGDVSTALRRKLGFAPDPKLARDFTQNVVALVVDSAPGELEPGMVAASFEAVLEGKAAPEPEGGAAPSVTLQQTAAAMLAWPPIAKRLRYVDAAWGGFPAVTGNRWSGDARGKQGNAAEVAFASAERKLQRLRLANEDGARTKAKIARNLCDERPGGRGLLWCPAMFMYSRADPIIPCEQVEAFATARAMRLGRTASAATGGEGAGGGLVTMKAWDDAPHCEMGRVDPEGYQRALKEFLAPPELEECEASFSNNIIKPWNRD
jgi:pimeloyl-ACP methyl ester carboxylesterase